MVGKTHVLGGSAFALGSYIVLRETGILNPDLESAAQLACIMPYAMWSATAPDFDQDNKDRAMASPINLAMQKFFNLMGAGHRSLKSHVYPALIATVLSAISITGVNIFGASNSNSAVVYCMVILGMAMGLLSHLLLDLCTKDGIRINGKRYAFVPEIDLFKADGIVEQIVRRFLYVLNILLFIVLFLL